MPVFQCVPLYTALSCTKVAATLHVAAILQRFWNDIAANSMLYRFIGQLGNTLIIQKKC